MRCVPEEVACVMKEDLSFTLSVTDLSEELFRRKSFLLFSSSELHIPLGHSQSNLYFVMPASPLE
jgi:hypothetical protein